MSSHDTSLNEIQAMLLKTGEMTADQYDRSDINGHFREERSCWNGLTQRCATGWSMRSRHLAHVAECISDTSNRIGARAAPRPELHRVVRPCSEQMANPVRPSRPDDVEARVTDVTRASPFRGVAASTYCQVRGATTSGLLGAEHGALTWRNVLQPPIDYSPCRPWRVTANVAFYLD